MKVSQIFKLMKKIREIIVEEIDKNEKDMSDNERIKNYFLIVSAIYHTSVIDWLENTKEDKEFIKLVLNMVDIVHKEFLKEIDKYKLISMDS